MRRLSAWTFPTLALPAIGLLAGCQPAPADEEGAPALVAHAREADSAEAPDGTVIDRFGPAVLSEIETASGPVTILRVAGTPSDMGYQYGRLVGNRVPEAWGALMSYMGKEMGMSADEAERILTPMLDRAYKHLDPYMPFDFREELQSIYDGATDAGVTFRTANGLDMALVLKYIIALTNTSDLNAFNDGGKAVAKMLATGTSAELDAFFKDQSRSPRARRGAESTAKMLGRTCSFFAAWGPRTEGGKLFASRNLDWASDTGIQSTALITIYQPTNGHAYATVGYAGLMGALAGMNEHGIVVSEVGSNSVLEKLKGEPWIIRNREILARASNLAEAVPYMVNNLPDANRPTTLGYNFMVGYGDPSGNGANASAAVFETNGGVVSMFHRGPAADNCRETPTLYHYDRDGAIYKVLGASQSSEVNSESATHEIDAAGKVRLFKVEDGAFVRDAQGYLIEDPYYGQPLQTGKYLECAIYRGDEAIGYGARRFQTASNGPSGEDPKEVMVDSGSYRNRYSVSHGILDALWSGAAYEHEGVRWVEEGDMRRQVTMDDATEMARAAAMDSNILSVVYDATSLKLRVAFESGSGDSWVRASDNAYTDIDLAKMFAQE